MGEDTQRLRSLPFHCHLIKYDPDRAFRGYDDGSWTSMSDVGKSFNGAVLTMEDYLATEQAHLDAIETMARESEVTRFRTRSSETPTLALAELLDCVRSALREEPGCGYLWNSVDRDFYVIVGYDFHAYVGSHKECTGGVDLALSAGLHPRVNEGPSPYLHE